MSNSITKISYCSEVTLITLSSLPSDSKAIAQVLTAFAEAGINVDMISQTAPRGGAIRLSFSVSDENLGSALVILGNLKKAHPQFTSEILPGNCKLAFFDADMVNTPGVAAQVFTLLSQANIEVMLITTSDVDISLLISDHALNDALQVVESHYGLTPEKTIF